MLTYGSSRTPSTPKSFAKSPNNPFVVKSPDTPTPTKSIFEYVYSIQ